MFKTYFVFTALCVLSSHLGFAQTKTKIEVAKRQICNVPTNILVVDTLILQDKATLRFAADKSGTLQVKAAYIGKKTLISAQGVNGLANSEEQNGGDLVIKIHFIRLGSLTIDTRGGRGKNGVLEKKGSNAVAVSTQTSQTVNSSGQSVTSTQYIPGSRATNSAKGTAGYPGGNGGNLTLTYSSQNLPVNFNRKKGLNSINILYQAGEYGYDGTKDTKGQGYIKGENGFYKYQEELPKPLDGNVQIINNPAWQASPSE